MQVIILAAGQSSRFYPFNTVHKSCIKVLGKTILEHTIDAVEKAGITDIIVVGGKDDVIKNLLLEKRPDLNITFVVQETADGAGEAILKAGGHITGDFYVLNANKVEFADVAKQLANAKKNSDEVVLLAKETDILHSFGVLQVEGDKVLDIIEKPEKGSEPSKYKVVGVYLFPKKFLEVLKNEKSHHYSLESAISLYAKEHFVRFVTADSATVSLKYPWDVLQMKDYLLSQMRGDVSKDAQIAESAVISGDVVIEKGAKVMEHATIKGPCYIGENAYIGTNAILRGGVILENDVVIGANMEVKNSFIGEGTTTHTGFIGDSVIGSHVKIAALFCSANVRLDRENVKAVCNNKEVDTGITSLGVMVGDDVAIGIRVSTMPGIIIGQNSMIGPDTTVMHNVLDNTKYYTKFKEIVEEKK